MTFGRTTADACFNSAKGFTGSFSGKDYYAMSLPMNRQTLPNKSSCHSVSEHATTAMKVLKVSWDL